MIIWLQSLSIPMQIAVVAIPAWLALCAGSFAFCTARGVYWVLTGQRAKLDAIIEEGIKKKLK